LRCPALDGLVSVTHSNSKGLVEAAALWVSKATVVAEVRRRTRDRPRGGHRVRRHAQRPAAACLGGPRPARSRTAHPRDPGGPPTHVIGGNDEDGVAKYLEKLYP